MAIQTPATRLIFSLACLAITTVGCGDGRPSLVPVSGVVTIDGQPVPCGAVRIIPDNMRPASGKISSDGRFTLTTFEPGDGCVPGTHAFVVIGYEDLDPQTRKWHAPKQYMAVNADRMVTIDGPTDLLQIELTWGGQPGPFVEKMDAGSE